MKPPSFKHSVLGHPVVGLPIMAAGSLMLYRCYLEPGIWPLAVPALIMMNAVATASGVRMKYLAWRSAWEAMGGGASSGNLVAGRAFVIILLGSMTAYMAAHSEVASYRTGLALMVMTGLGGGLLLLAKRLRQKRTFSPSGAALPVSICVNAPIVPVPPLAQAFAALPEHCLALR